ncbi:alkaline ceramidase 3-like isoform X4 [Clavelina lepadiformis]|uniref:alkaline ceramidase 3-like isoform X4 n=1 Tax=Clavelina lepadiformis TaxID=159417 RepID=UPI0040414908
MAPTAVDKSGIWGEPTSTLDWCEENYIVTPYIAEFWNTVSNLVMIIPSLVCAVYYWKKGIETRYLLANISLLTVGIGSWMFHMTLRYEMQLLDELPMIYGTCVFLYALRHHAKPSENRSGIYIFSLCLCCILVTAVYLHWQNPLFHQASYAILVLTLLYEAVIATQNYPQIKPVVLTSLVLYLFGFLLWNIDNNFCSSLRSLRASSSNNSPVKAATQLHAWWHIFTGYATYLHIVFSSYARTLHLKRTCSVQKLGGVWPYLEVKEKAY